MPVAEGLVLAGTEKEEVFVGSVKSDRFGSFL